MDQILGQSPNHLRNQYTGVGQIYAVGDCAGGNLATLGQAQAVRAVRMLGRHCLGRKTTGWFVLVDEKR